MREIAGPFPVPEIYFGQSEQRSSKIMILIIAVFQTIVLLNTRRYVENRKIGCKNNMANRVCNR